MRLITDVSVRRPGEQMAFQVIPKVYNGVKVRAMCRPLGFFNRKFDKLCFMEEQFVENMVRVLWSSDITKCTIMF